MGLLLLVGGTTVAVRTGVAPASGVLRFALPPGNDAPADPVVVQPTPPVPAPRDPAAVADPPAEVPAADEDLQLPLPVAVRVPSVGIDAQMHPLGLTPDGALDTPTDWDQAGWWHGGPEPGEPGRAVIAGHVDSFEGPAAFFGLHAVQPGDPIEVELAEGSVLVFTVQGVEQHGKDSFPTDRVYGGGEGPELRLVTCGGSFDWSARSYSDNVIVFAALTEVRSASAAG